MKKHKRECEEEKITYLCLYFVVYFCSYDEEGKKGSNEKENIYKIIVDRNIINRFLRFDVRCTLTFSLLATSLSLSFDSSGIGRFASHSHIHHCIAHSSNDFCSIKFIYLFLFSTTANDIYMYSFARHFAALALTCAHSTRTPFFLFLDLIFFSRIFANNYDWWNDYFIRP